MRILVTGAAGKTGKNIIKSLINKGVEVNAIVHRMEQREMIQSLGVSNVAVGDIGDQQWMQKQLSNIEAFYLIISNMNPDEVKLAGGIINSAVNLKLKKFVYHSVLYPQTSSMPHHWQKLLVEETLIKSGLDYTILQPTAYMQNILGYAGDIAHGFYPMPYPVSSFTTLVDLVDVACVAAKVLTETGHSFATYQLVGTPPITQVDIAEELSQHLKRDIIAREIKIADWLEQDNVKIMSEYSRNTLRLMFEYYANYGLCGNTNVLSFLLGREPTSLKEFLSRDYLIT